MGKIKKLLAADKIESRSLTSTSIWGDLCENVHLHFRNIRLDFSVVEWAFFRAAINHLGKAMEWGIEQYEWREGDPNFLVQFETNARIPANSDYFPDRVIIEIQRDNTVHFHYRDLRLHWTKQEFIAIAHMFMDAITKLDGVERGKYDFPGRDVKTATRMTVPIETVQPFDPGHLPLVEDKEHRDGIEYCKKLIRDGVRIRPILVSTDGQRLDGYKRYMAFKELGYDEIEVLVDPFTTELGGQFNQSMEDDQEEELAN